MKLNAAKVEELLDLAEEYAKLKNLIVDEYIDGMMHEMLADDKLQLNSYGMVNKLIEYHTTWIKDHKKRG